MFKIGFISQQPPEGWKYILASLNVLFTGAEKACGQTNLPHDTVQCCAAAMWSSAR